MTQALEVLEKCNHDVPTAMEKVFSQGLPKSEFRCAACNRGFQVGWQKLKVEVHSTMTTHVCFFILMQLVIMVDCTLTFNFCQPT